jgi:hypothetical protein
MKRPPIFTAEYVAAQGIEWAAELLNQCYYDLVAAETQGMKPQIVFSKSPRGSPGTTVCQCGGRKGPQSLTCQTCYLRSLRQH